MQISELNQRNKEFIVLNENLERKIDDSERNYILKIESFTKSQNEQFEINTQMKKEIECQKEQLHHLIESHANNLDIHKEKCEQLEKEKDAIIQFNDSLINQ